MACSGWVFCPRLLFRGPLPVIAAIVAATGTWLVYRIAAPVADDRKHGGFRKGQVATASLMSLAHGTNDAQKTMGRDLPGSGCFWHPD